MRIIHPKYFYTTIYPENKNILHFIPHLLPVFRVKVQHADIFVFFGRVFRKSNLSVGGPEKPARMFFYVRMVIRTVKRNIKCNFYSKFFCSMDKFLKVIKSSQFEIDRLMPPLLITYCPGTARVISSCINTVIGTFTICPSDGMYWRQVYDIKPHTFYINKSFFTIFKCCTLIRNFTLGPVKHFIPVGKSCLR